MYRTLKTNIYKFDDIELSFSFNGSELCEKKLDCTEHVKNICVRGNRFIFKRNVFHYLALLKNKVQRHELKKEFLYFSVRRLILLVSL